MTIEQRTPAYLPMISNPVLDQLAEAAFYSVGRQPISAELVKDFGGSTDMGNVSHILPAIHPKIGVEAGLTMHTREFTEAAGGAQMAATIRDGARILALTAIRAMSDPDVLPAAKVAFDSARASKL